MSIASMLVKATEAKPTETTSDYIFTAIKDGRVILQVNGVYKLVELAERRGHIYAKYGAGWVRLLQGERTSKDKVGYQDINLPFTPDFDTLGRMIRKHKTRSKKNLTRIDG